MKRDYLKHLGFTTSSAIVTANQTKAMSNIKFKPATAYLAKHTPTGETWYLLGIDPEDDRVCAAGWPATIGKLSDCTDFEERDPLSDNELNYRTKEFGTRWL